MSSFHTMTRGQDWGKAHTVCKIPFFYIVYILLSAGQELAL